MRIFTKFSFYISIILILSLEACVPAAITGAGSAAIAMSKDRTTDSMFTDLKIANSIKMNFIKRDFNNLYAKINVEVFNARVMLTGYLDNSTDKEQALDIVRENSDILEIIDELQVVNRRVAFNAAQYTKDSLITTQIKAKIFREKKIKARNYIIVTYQDVVYMLGVAASTAELEEVANIAANINGVRKVVSHVKISDNAESYTSNIPHSDNSDSATNNSDPEYVTVKEINTEWSKY